MNEENQDQNDIKLGVTVVAGTIAAVGITAFVLHRRKLNTVMRGMQLLLEEQTKEAWLEGYNDAIHHFIEGRLAGNLNKLNDLAAARFVA